MNTMRIYVGTYAKYNSGNLHGDWLDLSDYSDMEEFHDACKELHSTEDDPEFMFQDFEGIPEGLVSESHIDPLVFELASLDPHQVQVFEAYRSDVDQEGTLEQSQEAFRGTYENKRDYAQEMYSESEGELPQWVRSNIDWDGVVIDLEYGGTTFAFVGHSNGGYMVFC